MELARDADLFLCEATLAEASPSRAGTSRAEAVAAFAASGARRLLVTHRPHELAAGRTSSPTTGSSVEV